MSLGAVDFPQPLDTAVEKPAWRRVAVFYLLATTIALAGWLPYGAQLAGVLPGHIPAIVPVIAQYSPTIAALLLVAVEGGMRGLGVFFKRSLNPFVGARWFGVAVLTPPLMAAALIALHALEGGYVPGFAALGSLPDQVARFLQNTHDASGGAVAGSPLGSLALFARQGLAQALLVLFGLAFANGGISEEAGLARLCARQSARRAARAVRPRLPSDSSWGLWHTGPAFWAGILQSQWRIFSIPLEYTLGTIPLTVMIAWVFVNAKKSLLPGMFFHASYNGTFFLLTQIWTPGHAVVSIPEWLAATYAAALAVIVIGRKTMLARAGTGPSGAAP